jgi:hypothetical protein
MHSSIRPDGSLETIWKMTVRFLGVQAITIRLSGIPWNIQRRPSIDRIMRMSRMRVRGSTSLLSTISSLYFIVFTIWPARLKLQLSPNAPLATGQRHLQIMPVVVGVAHEVGGQLLRSVVSGMVGLGRRLVFGMTKKLSSEKQTEWRRRVKMNRQ